MLPTPSLPWKPLTSPINVLQPDDKPPTYRVMIARFPGGGVEHSDCVDWLAQTSLAMSKDPRISEVAFSKFCGTPVTTLRNRAVLTSMHREIDYLLMVDNDMKPDCEPLAPRFWDVAWSFMMKRREKESADMKGRVGSPESVFDFWWTRYAPGAIGAPYCGNPPFEPCYVMRFAESGGTMSPDLIPSLAQYDRWDASRRTGVQQVGALPTGLILFDVRMFYYLPIPWFEYEYENDFHDTVDTTEDVYLSRNAALLGAPQWVAWDSWAGHNKNKLVRKPHPITQDAVNAKLADAIRLNLNSRRKLGRVVAS